jgi:peptidoglycan/LPS O-acetylase OafA/YrhL
VPESRPFFGRIESLRGLGALAVAAYHFTGCVVHGVQLLPDTPWDGADRVQNAIRWASLAFLPAHAAVMAFFVISGFVLRLSLEYGPQQPGIATARFFISRVFRAYPIVFFAFALIALTAPPGTLTGRRVIASVLLIDVSWNSVLWALKLELLMAPIIVALYYLERRFGLRASIAVALATTPLAFKPSWAGWPPLSTNLFAFVLGMLIPTLGHRYVTNSSRRGAAGWLGVALLVFVLPNPCFGRYSKFSTVVEAYAAFWLVSCVAYRRDLVALRWLDAKPLRWLGLSSVSYYVLHTATYSLMMVVATALVPATWSATAPALVGVLVISVWLVAFAPVSLATYYLIEAPGIALGRRVVRVLRTGTKPTGVPESVPGTEVQAPRRAA